MKRVWRVVLGFIVVASGYANAQSKIDPPQMIQGRNIQKISPEQVRVCLFLARDISDLTDRADVAKDRGDTETFNATVDPYNTAIGRWNAGCTKAYDPGDMIRAENQSGMRLCKFTSTPCLTELERSTILAQELARQGHASSQQEQMGLQRTTGRVRKPAVENTPELSSPFDGLRDLDCSTPATQVEMNACASNELARETKQINSTYNSLRGSVSPEQAAELKFVQLLWIKYKDAACELESKSAEGGSMQPLLRDTCLTRLTKVRNQELSSLVE